MFFTQDRTSQTTEYDFCVMLKGQGLLLEFWDEAALTGAYIQNRIINGLISSDKIFSLYKAYYSEIPKIDYFRKFRY